MNKNITYGQWLNIWVNLYKKPCSFGVSWCSLHRSATQRSKTFYGVAEAMAKQWG